MAITEKFQATPEVDHVRIAPETVQPIAKETVTIELPCQARPSGYVTKHLNIQLTERQGEALKRVAESLDAKAMRMANGRVVQSVTDAARFILDSLADRIEQQDRKR